VRDGIGVADIPVKIVGVSRWRSVSNVARHYQVGRAFIAGDAAHVMPPNGGFGGNTGIHDAHNLAWKLAYALKGWAPNLPSTYETERRPVGKFTVEQAYSRYVTRSAAYLGAKDFEPVAHDFDIEVGYRYHSPAILSESGDEKAPRVAERILRPTGFARAASVARARRPPGLDARSVRHGLHVAGGTRRGRLGRSGAAIPESDRGCPRHRPRCPGTLIVPSPNRSAFPPAARR